MRVMGLTNDSVMFTDDFCTPLCDHCRVNVSRCCRDGQCQQCTGCACTCHDRDVRASHGALLDAPAGWRDLVRKELVGAR